MNIFRSVGSAIAGWFSRSPQASERPVGLKVADNVLPDLYERAAKIPGVDVEKASETARHSFDELMKTLG